MHPQPSLPEALANDFAGVNRRACVRYRCTRPLPRRMALAESYTSLDGWLVDVSTSGLALLLDCPLDVGTLLFVELESATESVPVELLASIVRVTANSEAEWLVGCELVNRLSEAELKALLL
jgi:hypothetical protein